MTHRRHLSPLRGWDWTFDSGGAASVTDEGGAIRITPRFDFNSKWLWFALRSDRLAGAAPHFLIAKANRQTNVYAGECLAFWSQGLDTDTWHPFDNQSVGASDIEFYNNAPFPSGRVYVAGLPLYPFSRIERKAREWLKDARVSVVSVGQATPRIATGGRVSPGAPFLGLKATNASGYTKNNMVLSAFNHPNETTGAWQLEGFMSWLLGGSVQAEFLLDWFDVYIYPCLNPQGVIGGYFRSFPQDTTKDHNRIWDTTGSYECIDAIKTAFTANHADIEVGIDFHGSYAAGAHYMDSEDHTATLYAAFLAKMVALDATYSYLDETITTSLGYLLQHSLSAELGFFSECVAQTALTMPTSWKTNGQYVGQSLAAMHADGRWTNGPGVGCRDMNGLTDRVDWANVANLNGSALTISAWVKVDAVEHNSYLMTQHDASDTNLGIVFNMPGNTALTFIRRGAGNYTWNAINLPNFTSPSTWFHILVTSDGGLLSSSVAFYLNGTSKTVSFANSSGAETAHTGSWSLGGRIYDDTRNLDGKIAQVGVWSRVLNSTEIANLAAGQAPDLAAASSLLFYFKGNTSSLANSVAGGANGTADGTSQVTGVGNGPSIIYG